MADMKSQDLTYEFDPADINKNKTIAGLSYIWVLFFLPLVACPDSAFGRFHANQALLLFIGSFVAGIISAIPFIGWIVGAALSVFLFVCFILGLINAFGGKAKTLPLIGGITIIK